jgi:hypothetical protein
LPYQLLFYFFEISNGKKLHEETQQYWCCEKATAIRKLYKRFPERPWSIFEVYLKFKSINKKIYKIWNKTKNSKKSRKNNKINSNKIL